MVEDEFLILSQLFDSIGVIEKGIEKIYRYLLKNKRIENLNQVCEEYDLTLKRGYKICSVLSDLKLVQIYDRPMKIFLQTDVVPLWQKLVNQRIETLQKQFQEEKKKSEFNLEEFLKAYDLKEKEIQEPVEFFSLNVPNFSEILRNYMVASTECRVAMGIHYENPLSPLLKEHEIEKVKKILESQISPELELINPKFKNLKVMIVVNEELFLELIKSEEYALLNQLISPMDIEFRKIEARITDANFSNFSLTDDELIQPSFDPTNKLIGCYISRNKNIYQIFYDKFIELSENGLFLEEFSEQHASLKINPLTDKNMLALSLL